MSNDLKVVYVNKQLHKKLKLESTKKNMSIRELVEQLIYRSYKSMVKEDLEEELRK